MDRMDKIKILMIFSISILLLSALSFSGWFEDDEGGVVGIPEGEDPEADIHEDYIEISVKIMNTYEEPKQIVMKFEVGTVEGGRYSENQFITLPESSRELYSQVVEIPVNETGDFVDTEIIVNEDETRIIDVRGESYDGSATINVTIANTNFDSEKVLIEFIVKTENGVYNEKKSIKVSKSSVEVHQGEVEIPSDETPIDFDVQIT
ncbi:MAG: hypothetical protein KGY68_05515 [Candidatus Thermoplasmatota archaeon]|nr:hypothetical protein [Candidatus Thermoplasmatota archaeon]